MDNWNHRKQSWGTIVTRIESQGHRKSSIEFKMEIWASLPAKGKDLF